jgi:hypothetical protein
MAPLFAIAVALAATGPVGVGLSSSRPGADAEAALALIRTEQALSQAGVPSLLTSQETKKRLTGGNDPKKCAGGRKCLKVLALVLGPKAVMVGVDVARLDDEVVVHLEAVAADSDAALAVKDVTVKIKNVGDGLVAPLAAFAKELKAKLTPKPEPVAKTEPPKPPPPSEVGNAETPTQSDRPVVEATVAPPEKSVAEGPLASTPGLGAKGPKGTVVAGVMTGAAAVVAGAIAVAFTVLASNDQTQWEANRYTAADGTSGTRLSADAAGALATQANNRFTVALGTGIGAGALAITSVILLTR